MKWFTANPVLMGCLVPVVLFVLTILTVSRLAMLSAGPFELLLTLVLPVLWALVVWTLWFGRSRG